MIHLIIGRQGSGKTLYLVKKAIEYYTQHKNIYSNIKFNFPFNEINYQDIVDCKYDNGVVFLDEIHLLLPARASMSRHSRIICDSFLSMVRKKGLEVFGTTQTMRKVDVRFREEADFIYICKKYAFIDNKWKEIMISDNLPKNVKIMINMVVQETFTGNEVEYSFLGNDFFRHYDTRQIIKIKGLETNYSRNERKDKLRKRK